MTIESQKINASEEPVLVFLFQRFGVRTEIEVLEKLAYLQPVEILSLLDAYLYWRIRSMLP